MGLTDTCPNWWTKCLGCSRLCSWTVTHMGQATAIGWGSSWAERHSCHRYQTCSRMFIHVYPHQLLLYSWKKVPRTTVVEHSDGHCLHSLVPVYRILPASRLECVWLFLLGHVWPELPSLSFFGHDLGRHRSHPRKEVWQGPGRWEKAPKSANLRKPSLGTPRPLCPGRFDADMKIWAFKDVTLQPAALWNVHVENALDCVRGYVVAKCHKRLDVEKWRKCCHNQIADDSRCTRRWTQGHLGTPWRINAHRGSPIQKDGLENWEWVGSRKLMKTRQCQVTGEKETWLIWN